MKAGLHSVSNNKMASIFWTNPSVLALGGDSDPLETISSKARSVVFHALERGWKGPPFDPLSLADLLSIETCPTSEVLDARTIPLSGKRFRIEFNPDRPNRRIRYSIFHEIAHTLFPDCAQMIRNRGAHIATRRDDWQLEALCNVAAAEFLLPTGSLGQVSSLPASIDTVLELRQKYEASAEASMLRIGRLTSDSAVAFSCHRDRSGRYVLEYAVPANTEWRLRPGSPLPANTVAAECTAIGYTAKQAEHWPQLGPINVECVGIAPLPKSIYPRVIGFLRPQHSHGTKAVSITYLRGDATLTRGTDPKLLVQVVNDSALSWGGAGFTTSVKRRWPGAQGVFTNQVVRDRNKLRLGNLIAFTVEPDVTLASIVAQRGYGSSSHPLVRYAALRDGLVQVAQLAHKLSASIHMPRIGTGQAGGSWAVVEELIKETLTQAGLRVIVYDLPQGREKPKAQTDLAFGT